MSFHPFQTIQEALLTILMMLLLVFNVSGDVLILNIIEHHSQTITILKVDTQQVEANQHTNSLALKDYIACLLTINTQNNLQGQEQACFDKAPQVK